MMCNGSMQIRSDFQPILADFRFDLSRFLEEISSTKAERLLSDVGIN